MPAAVATAMARADFFARRGLFVKEAFLEPEFCASLCTELRTRSGKPHTVEQGGEYLVDEKVGKTTSIDVSSVTRGAVHERLLSLRPELENHFSLPLSGCEAPTFVVYRPGDYFRPHTDVGTEQSPEHLQARKLVGVAYLNDETDEPVAGSYGGGSLTLYDLLSEPPWREMGFPLVGEAGLLIVFPAEMVHEVTEVTHGERCVIVSRFY
jgi:predicted 2-oxoglutarate/Fe(II)-dependent dioxygenase YbiX